MKLNNKGVTMMMLVITMIMLFILISIAVYSSQKVPNEAKYSSTYASLISVKEACENAIGLIEIANTNGSADYSKTVDEFTYFGKTIYEESGDINISELKTKCGLADADSFGRRTYLIENKANDIDDRRRLEALDLRNLSIRVVADLDNNRYYVVGGAKRKNGVPVYELKDFIYGYDALVGEK